MSIVASVYVLDGPIQADGRRYVTEFHTDHLGSVHKVQYLATAGADYQTIANLRAAEIVGFLAEQEAETIINA